MPFWKFHDYWAEKMGIDRKVSHFVNLHEDRIWRHEAIKKGKEPPDLRTKVDLLRRKGSDYVKALFLHLFLDEIIDASTDELILQSPDVGPPGFLEEIIRNWFLGDAKKAVRQVGERLRAYPESNSVKVFVLDHLEEILISYYRQTRALGAVEILERDGKLVYCDTSQTDLWDYLGTSHRRQ